MTISNISQTFASSKGILAFPDHYVGVAQVFTQGHALAVTTTEGRKIIKAGTIYPANDATAWGIVLSDLDVTDGDKTGAVIVHGFVATAKLPAVPATAAKTALNMIKFLPLADTGTPTISATVGTIGAGQPLNSKLVVAVTMAKQTFRDEAATIANWTLTNESVTKMALTGVTLSEDRYVAYLTFTASAATVAGTVTATPKTNAVSLGVAPAAINVVTVA